MQIFRNKENRLLCSALQHHCKKISAVMADNLHSIEQRYAIKFMQKEGETFTNCYTRLRAVYREQCMSRCRVFEWFKRFRDGRASTDNNSRSGRPATAVNDENITKVNELIRSDRRLNVRDIMTSLSIGARAANEIIHDRLGYSKVCARWVPRQLTPACYFLRERHHGPSPTLAKVYCIAGDGDYVEK